MRNLFDLFEDKRKQNQQLSVQPAMIRKVCLLLLFGLGYGFAQPAIPSTPAGQTLQAWLDAFNSGDRAKLAAYVKNTDPSESVEGMMGFHSQTGGFDLLSIESSEPLSIIF